jgi:hypothetical protein
LGPFVWAKTNFPSDFQGFNLTMWEILGWEFFERY